MQQSGGALGALFSWLASLSVYSGGLLVAVGPVVRVATAEMVHKCAQFTVNCHV
jgi:flavin reductase (DIM6/NTAB) family NADH-FMN oxidoreductase RutF